MTHASVFSGIGGPEVAATMLGWENLFHCEINPFGRKVLEYWYPNSKSYDDITKTDFSEWRGRVDVLTGGFPCQPFSYAGQRRGAQDDRYLWPYMFKCIDQVRPDWVVAENVAGITTMVEQGEVSPLASQASLFDTSDDIRRYRLSETFTLQRICDDLERHGYSVQPVLIPACAVGAPHRRDRVFIVGHRIASDSDDNRTLRDTRKHEGESCQERIQERDEVQLPDKPNHVRPTSEGNAPTDSACGGERTSRPSGEPESSRGDTHQQPSERRAATERLDRLHAILRPSADTEHLRLQHDAGRGEQAADIGTQSRGGQDVLSEQIQRIATISEGRPTTIPRHATHPDSHRGCEVDEHMESELADGTKPVSNGGQRNVADTESRRAGGLRIESEEEGTRMRDVVFGNGCRLHLPTDEAGLGRWQNFPSVSPVHRGNDGLPFDVDRLTLSFGKWRTEALKAYGNAIVVQVMYEIFRAIQITEESWNNGKK